LKLNNETVDFVVLSIFTELQIQQFQTSGNNGKKNSNKRYKTAIFE